MTLLSVATNNCTIHSATNILNSSEASLCECNSFQNSLKSMYDSARSDFRRVEEVTRVGNSDRLPPAVSNELRTITSVANELCLFLTARIELIDLYPSENKKLYLQIRRKDCLYGIWRICISCWLYWNLWPELKSQLIWGWLKWQLWRLHKHNFNHTINFWCMMS